MISALLVGITTIALSVKGDFRGGRGTGGPPSKDKGALKKWLDGLADALKRLAGKAVAALPAIVGIVVDVVLNFLGKAVAFVAEHVWALIVFVVGFIAAWLMQRVQKGYVLASACLIKSFVFFSRLDIFNTFLRYLVSYGATYDNS